MTQNRKTPQKANVSDQGEKLHLYSKTKPRYNRPHKYLTAKQVEALFSGCEKAYNQGTPLNRFITVHYDDYANLRKPIIFVTDILERTRKWLKYRGLPVAYLYVIENGKNKGIHTHILLHIPAHYQREYKRALKKWLPFECNPQRLKVRTIPYAHYGELSPMSKALGTLSYMCKGINPKEAIRGIAPKDQGEVYGKRWGISESLK